MASTFTTLGIEKMATGENAGTWGDKTNTNLDIVNTAISGYVEQAVTSGGTTALSIADGAATSTAQNAVIKLTGTISGNSIVTVPDSVEKVYVVTNGTSGAYTVQFKTASGSGITFGISEKTTKFVYSDGTNIVDAGFSGGTDLDGKELILDADGDTSLTADTDDQIDIKIAGTDQIKLVDGAIVPVTDNDIDLGTASLEFKDAFFDGTVTSDAFAGPLTGNVTGNVSGTAATVTTAAQSNITSLGTLTTLTVDDITINGSTISDAGDFTLDVEGDIILDANGADVFLKDAGTTYGSLTNSSGNLIVKSGTTTALTFSGANVTVAGDLTVSGDDITMGTNTDGNLLVADGTNFNSIAVSSLSEISTAAADDVFIAIDTSGGGLKRIARSAVVAGLATDSAISNVVDDTTPQLGGNLDMNGADIVTTSNATIDLAPNGTGTVVVRGNTNSGAIVFNCESNSHGQTVIAQPHSASVTNSMLLPAGASSTLVSLVSTDTLTNKTLTSPKINEDVAVTSTATELNILDGVTTTAAEINLIDGGTSRGTTAVADADGILHNDGGTMRMTSAATFKTYFTSGVSSAADDITAGDAAVGITTSSGNITVDSNAGAISIDGHTGVTLASSSSGDITLDSVADIVLDAAGNDFSFKAGGTEILKITNSSSDVIIKPIVDAKDIIFQQRDGTEVARIEDNGTFNVVTSKLAINGTAVTSTAAELNLLDGVSGLVQADLTKLAAVDSTAAELNIVDGGTSATSTTVADADRVVLNDAGTMVQVAMTDIKTYIGGGTSWQAVKTGDFTAAAGQGVFANTTSASFTVTLPASPDLGDEVSIKDYAGTFDSNALTIGRNSQPIEGVAADLTVGVERAGLTLVYTDGTQGWLLKDK